MDDRKEKEQDFRYHNTDKKDNELEEYLNCCINDIDNELDFVVKEKRRRWK